MSGPFETERDARTAAHQVIQPDPGWSILRADGNRELLRRALSAAGVTNGAYDDRILHWLGTWEDSVVSVIAGWITRAAPPAPGLADDDRAVIGRACTLAAATTDPQLRAMLRAQGTPVPAGTSSGYLYGAALSSAQQVIAGLLAIIEHAGGHPYPASAETGASDPDGQP